MDCKGEPKSAFLLNVGAAEFIPREPVYAAETAPVYDVADVADSINYLRSSPESFFDVAFPLAGRLSSSLVDDDTLAVIVETIFIECCHDANFRYTGARLCAFLCKNLPDDFARSFRTETLRRCKREYDGRADLSATDLVNFTLFIGELMHNLTIGAKVIDIFPRITIDLLDRILSLRTDECVRGFTQAMKLVGAILEKHESEKMKKLFDEVKQLTTAEGTTERQSRMLLSLIELRAERFHTDDQCSALADSLAVVDLQQDGVKSSGNTAAGGDNGNGNTGDNDLVVYSEDCDEDQDEFDDFDNNTEFEIVYDGDVQYVVQRDMDADMEAEFEKFIAENEARSK